jgi:phospholipase/carboxylesterase
VQIETNATILDRFGWTFRVRPLSEDASRILLLIHGWTGDESSMWTFTRNIPSSYAIISPRAPYSAPADKGGYSWRKIKPGTWGSPTLEELRLAATALVSLVDNWQDSVKMTSTTFDIVGFSQGAALATTIAALHPSRVDKVAVLSGFIPPGVDSLLRPGLLDDARFFWAHGKEDELVPIERGMESIKLLEDAGAKVHLCLADIGHKVSKDCRRALDAFLSEK